MSPRSSARRPDAEHRAARRAEQLSVVRSLRRAHGLSQAALAEAVGVSRQTVISIEQGDYAPSVYLALRLARVLGATVEDLFGDETGDQ